MMYKTIALPLLLLFSSILFCIFSVAMRSNILGEKHTQPKLYTGFVFKKLTFFFFNDFTLFYFVLLTAEVQVNFQSY